MFKLMIGEDLTELKGGEKQHSGRCGVLLRDALGVSGLP